MGGSVNLGLGTFRHEYGGGLPRYLQRMSYVSTEAGIKIGKMQMAVVCAHPLMGSCQFSWLPSEAQGCDFHEVRKLWSRVVMKLGKQYSPITKNILSPLEGVGVQSKWIIS